MVAFMGRYLFAFFCFGRISHLKLSSLGDWPSIRVVGGMFFGPFFHLFSSDFGSQICSSSPIFD
jgi:hypothetical protein